MSNAVFAKKNMKNMRKQRHIKLVTAKARENYLLSLLNFKRNVLAIEMKKKDVFMNKPVYLDLSILEINKVVIYEFWQDVKPKIEKNAELCYKDTDNFTVYIKTEDIYVDIAKNDEKRFDTSDYGLKRPSPSRKSKLLN